MSFSRQISLVVPQLNRPNQTLQQHQQPLQWSGKNMEKSSFKHPKEAFRTSVSQKTRVQQHDQLTQQQEQLKDQQKDKLTVLHSRLQQEAEKIRKWKTITEMELKQKDQKLQEAKLTIDRQQKQMLDIQLEKESLDSCIKDTATNQKEMHRKINSTRDMCHALKEHTLRIEQALELGEGDRTVLIERNQELMEQYQELGQKFNQLEKMQCDTHATFNVQISKERNHIEELSKELEIQRKDSETKLTTVEEELSLCNAKLEKLLNDLQLKEQLIVSLTDEKTSIEKDLACKEDRISSLLLDLESCNTTVAKKNEELLSVSEKLLLVTNERNTHKEEITRLEDVIAAMRKEHDEEMRVVKCEKQELNNVLENTEQRLVSIQKDLVSSEEDKSRLQNKCNELESALQLTTDDKSELSTKLNTLQEEFDRVTSDHNSAQQQLSLCQTLLEDIREQLVDKEAEKESVIVEWSKKLETEHETTLSKTNELLRIQSELEREKQELMDKLTVAENDRNCVQSENDSLKDSLTNMTTTMEAKIVMLKEKASQAEKECTRLQLSVQDFTAVIEDKNKTIGNCSQKVNDLTEVIEKRDDSLCHLKYKYVALEEQLSTSNNQLLAMTSELDTLKGQYSSLIAETTTLQSTLEQQSDNQSSSLSQLKEEIDKLQEALKMSRVEENKLKAMVDAQAREMGVTLERYKMENTRIVAMKDKELETLKDQELKEKGRLMTNINDLEERIQINSAQKKELTEKVADLEKQLTVKEEELTQLIAATSTLQLATPMVHKTPPHLVKLVQSKPMTPSKPKRMTKPKYPASEKRIPFSPLVSSTPYNQQRKPFGSSTLPTKLYDGKLAGDEEDLSDRNVKETVAKKTLNKVLMGVGNNTPKGRPGRKPGLKRKQSKKENKDPKGMDNLSWFDLDPVFGFPPED